MKQGLTNDFIIRGYRLGDEYPVLEMFNEVFNQNREISHWHWKYRDHPWGSHYVSLALTPEGLPVAHYGGYPVRMTMNSPRNPSREFLTFQLGDKMTRAEFRNVGLRTKSLLARVFFHFRDLYGQNTPFGYGFGAHHSLRLGILLFKYMNVEKIPYRRIELSQLKHSWRSKFFRSFSGVSVEEVFDVDVTWTELFNRVAPHYSCLTTRSSEYLRWRYLKRPDKKYLLLALRQKSRLAGWSVFSRNGGMIEWVDGLFDPMYGHFTGQMLDYLKNHLIAAEARYIHCWFPTRPNWWDSILKDLGFVSLQEPNDIHLTGPIFTEPGSEMFLRENFYYTMGDSDLY